MKYHTNRLRAALWASTILILTTSMDVPDSVSAQNLTAKDASALEGARDATRLKRLQTEEVTFAVIGDYGSGEQPEADVANLVKSWNPDFIVTVGDNNYPNGGADTIDRNIGQYYHEFIYPYDGSYGEGADHRRFFPVLGNHDWSTGDANPYFNYFSFYSKRGYYEFVDGPLHFFMLDSDNKEPDGNSVDSKQAKWLRNGLSQSTSVFNIVVMHHPPFSSGWHGSTTALQWPYQTWGADVVLSGHDHLYERIIIEDFPYFVNGIGGGSIYSFGTLVPGSRVRFNQDYGAMRVDANGTTLNFQAYTRAGTLIDEYALVKNAPSVSAITRNNSNPTNLSSVEFAVTFSEPVSGVDASDFVLTSTEPGGAVISAVSGTGTAYRVAVNTGAVDTMIGLNLVDDDSIIGGGIPLGNYGLRNGDFTATEFYTLDKTSPMLLGITRAGVNPTDSATVDFSIAFSEPVVGFDAADLSLATSSISGAVIGSLVGDGSSYVGTVNTGQADDVVGLNLLDDDSITDLAGNKLSGLNPTSANLLLGESYIIDKLDPIATSILRGGANPAALRGGANPAAASTLDFIVNFSEPVAGVDASDFIVSTSPSAEAAILSILGSDSAYNVSVALGAGADTVGLVLIDDDTITDMLGHKLGGAGLANGVFVSGETYSIGSPAPAVSSILRASANPTNISAVDYILTFSEAVTGVDVSDFSVSMSGINAASVTAVSGSADSYSVSVNTGTGDGTLLLQLLDDDSIVNASGKSLGGPGIQNGSYVTAEAFSIDRTAPVVTSIIRAGPDPSTASNVDYIVTFSESVLGVDAGDFSPDSSSIIYASVIGVNNVNPFYIVTLNSGLGTGFLRLDFTDNDSISDLAGNIAGGPGINNADFRDSEAFTISKSVVNFPPPFIRRYNRNLATNNPSPTLGWALVRGAPAYEIFIGLDENLTEIISSHVISDLSYTVTPPLTDGTYYWRVRAYNLAL